MDVNRELISRYADGQTTEEERKLAEQLVLDDPQASLDLDEYRLIEELFGHVEPESVSEECLERLYEIDAVPAQAQFERVEMAPVRSIRWGSWAAAAAAILLAVVGISHLTYKPQVELRDFARLSLDATGAVIKTERLATVSLESGSELVAGPRERITYRDELDTRVVLMPESRLELGDPREGEVMELIDGTALLTVQDSEEPRIVEAGGFIVRSHGAEFAVRIKGGGERAAGASIRKSGLRVTVAVRTGRCEVGSNGDRQEVGALWRVVLRRDAPAERSRIWEGPLFANLMENASLMGNWGHELLPGFYSGEAGVRAIRLHGWTRMGAGEYELVVSDNQAASIASWLVFETELDAPSRIELVMVRPLPPAAGAEEGVRSGVRRAIETVVATPHIPAGRRVVAIPLESFQGAEARKRTIEIPASRSRLVRLRLRTVDKDRKFKLTRSLWSARPPASNSEVIR